MRSAMSSSMGSTRKSAMGKSKSRSKSTTKKRSAKPLTLYRRLYNMYGKSNLVKPSKYVSKTECFIALYLSLYYTVIQQYKVKGVKHVYDMYLPKYNLIIEYDGAKWHKDRDKDNAIDKEAKANGYKIMRIKEKPYYEGGKLKYVKKLMGHVDLSMNTKTLTSFQKNILKDFWRK